MAERHFVCNIQFSTNTLSFHGSALHNSPLEGDIWHIKRSTEQASEQWLTWLLYSIILRSAIQHIQYKAIKYRLITISILFPVFTYQGCFHWNCWGSRRPLIYWNPTRVVHVNLIYALDLHTIVWSMRDCQWRTQILHWKTKAAAPLCNNISLQVKVFDDHLICTLNLNLQNNQKQSDQCSGPKHFPHRKKH